MNTYNDSDGILGSTEAHYEKPSIFVPLLGCITLLLLYITCGAASIADTQNIEFRYDFFKNRTTEKIFLIDYIFALTENEHFFSVMPFTFASLRCVQLVLVEIG